MDANVNRKKHLPMQVLFWLMTIILIQKSTKNIFFNFRQNRLFNVDNFFEKSLDRKRGIKRYFQPLLRENICFQSIGFFARRQTNSCAIRKQSIGLRNCAINISLLVPIHRKWFPVRLFEYTFGYCCLKSNQ